LSDGKSLSLVLGAVIIVAILASTLTYYYAMSNLPTVTTTVTLPLTITTTTTATQSVTMTKTNTVTTTEYVTLPPSTTTVTITTTPTTSTITPGKVITVPRNDTLAKRLIESELKQRLALTIMTWVIWLKMRSGPFSTAFHNDPAATLATTLAMRLASQDIVALPPLKSRYAINYSETHVTIHMTPLLGGNGTCLPLNIVGGEGGATNVSAVLEPINASAVKAELSSNFPPPAGSSVMEDIIVVSGDTVKVTENSKFTTGSGRTITAQALIIFRHDIPSVFRVTYGNLTYEASINASNGALILKASGSTIRVVEGMESALKELLKSFNITVTYEGTTSLAESLIVPFYRVTMMGNAKLRIENITLSISLSYYGHAYSIGNNTLIFTKNSLTSLRAIITVGENTYCRYIPEPVETNVKVRAVSIG